ncbi:Tim44 domain-containing protein [Pseudooceanicola sediminis]|uniref:Tim44 domain-containing protein n=1 Tax=Pseudooceanicola sediminis TaxID=2211117 RepID=A0A399J713_9RHOB|nr:Tim44/TimA family putative adaptor protein [Pseudooceanicola sediminis]KAA2315456.1 Tim44 domain-containing protein [Puniceibacterium sp. HSS470]RII40337.1 Tim44 domain-containing protein [Pseudooceanicola sediminis]|tara:strand:- start:32712 stop:33371 length:660 start_codon:yes stop_codon:yes gene_type:complete
MNSPILQLLVLAGIAVFLILRLRNVLGTREGFEKPPVATSPQPTARSTSFEVIEGGPDPDITDHVPANSPSARAIEKMKSIEPGFSVSEFLGGARAAYEMILMGFEKGELDDVRAFLAPDVYASFAQVVDMREQQGLTVEGEFVGVKEMTLTEAVFHEDTQTAELTVRYLGQLTQVVRDANGEIVEGEPGKVKTQLDIWTFERKMGSDNVNWQLVATGE